MRAKAAGSHPTATCAWCQRPPCPMARLCWLSPTLGGGTGPPHALGARWPGLSRVTHRAGHHRCPSPPLPSLPFHLSALPAGPAAPKTSGKRKTKSARGEAPQAGGWQGAALWGQPSPKPPSCPARGGSACPSAPAVLPAGPAASRRPGGRTGAAAAARTALRSPPTTATPNPPAGRSTPEGVSPGWGPLWGGCEGSRAMLQHQGCLEVVGDAAPRFQTRWEIVNWEKPQKQFLAPFRASAKPVLQPQLGCHLRAGLGMEGTHQPPP